MYGVLKLSKPSKLGGARATGTLPYVTCPGARVQDARDVCYTCYAAHGRSMFSSVRNVQEHNTTLLNAAAMRGVDAVVELYDKSIDLHKQAKTTPWFRFHWSGDVSCPVLFRGMVEYVKLRPDFRFLLFTKSWRTPWFASEVRQGLPENLVVRPSSVRVEELPPRIPGCNPGTSVHTAEVPEGVFLCPGECRACGYKCWDATVGPVGFHWHGGADVRATKYKELLRCLAVHREETTG